MRVPGSAGGVSKRHASHVLKVVIRDSAAFTSTSTNKTKCLLISWFLGPKANSLVLSYFSFTAITSVTYAVTGQHSKVPVYERPGVEGEMFRPKVEALAGWRPWSCVGPVPPAGKIKPSPKCLFILRAARVSRTKVKFYKNLGQMLPIVARRLDMPALY